VQATVEIMQTGLPIARIEFLDEKSIQANNVYNKLSLEETPHLFLEFHGSKNTVDQQAELTSESILCLFVCLFFLLLFDCIIAYLFQKFLEEICANNNSKDFKWATDLEERNKLWQARHNSWFAFKALHPNRRVLLLIGYYIKFDRKTFIRESECSHFKAISTDVCVPISKLPEVLVQTKKDIETYKLKTIIVGHVGKVKGDACRFKNSI
jgi:D-lactate dehydrogenase (cytochrome)